MKRNTPKRKSWHGWIILAAAVMVLSGATALHVQFTRQMVSLVSDQFNQEQLTVARSIQKLIENALNSLDQELLQLAGRVASPASDLTTWPTVLTPSLERGPTAGFAELLVWDRIVGTVRLFSGGQFQPDPSASASIQAVRYLPQQGEIGVFRPSAPGPNIHMYLITPMYASKGQYILLRINLAWFLAPLLKDVRSGSSGYAWIIDDQGRFLYHPFTDFVGQSAFDVRKETYPELDFVKIDRIQKEEMLLGREGVGTYQSAWHRGITGTISKLIAFCPVHISHRPRQFWSVAVVAPTHEIADAVGKIHRWQLLLQGVTIAVVAAAATALYLLEMRFSRRMERLVDARTMELKRSEEKYRLLIESAEDFIFTVDASSRLESVNSYTANFFGSDADHLVGRSLTDLLSEDVANRNVKAIQHVFATGRSVREEIEIRSVDPSVWLNANYMPLKNEAGGVRTVLCIARDVTESKNLQHRLVTTEKLAALGTLAAGVAHEINNPLGVILGFCDLLVRKQLPESQAYQDLKIIERQGLHCKAIVDNLLSFARDRKVSEESTDLNPCLEEIIAVARHSIERRMVTMKTEIAAHLPPVRGDSRQLQQVFLNLMNNAVDAMPDGGELTVTAVYDKGARRAVVKVSDTGYGIPEALLDRIYEPFFTTKPEGEGTGLGLFVSYGIISSFGGAIHCESRVALKNGDKSGTTFVVTLPQHSQEA